MKPESRFAVYPIPDDVIDKQSQHPLLVDLYPIRAGHFFRAAGHYTIRETIGEYIVFYCHSGSGWLRMAERLHHITPGDVTFVLKDMAHEYGADETTPWSIYWSHFGGQQADQLLQLAQVTASEPVIHVGERMQVLSLFAALAETLQSGYSLHHLIKAAATLRHLLSELALLHVYAPAQDTKGLDVEQTINYMLEHLTETYTLDELAAQAHLSRSHFSHQFRLSTGYAPIDYLIRLKIQKACEFLETTPTTIEQISAILGYQDPYYFSRLFKKIVGMPPSEYRNWRKLHKT